MRNFIKSLVSGFIIISSVILMSCKAEVATVITSPVTGITASSATGGGAVSSAGTAPVIERGLCWSKSTFPTVRDERMIEGSGLGSFVCQLANLAPSTIYYVRAYGINEAGIAYGNEENFTTNSSTLPSGSQIIADHTVVDKYDDIPQQWIDSVKTMLVEIGGQSHSTGYQHGVNLLELYDSRFQVLTYQGSPPAPSSSYLRLGEIGSGYGQGIWTWQYGIDSFLGDLTTRNNTGNPWDVFAYAWCYDMSWQNDVGGTEDPVYSVHWAGSSVGGPQGNLRWGLDSGDQALTGNSVCMDTYLNAVEQWVAYCKSHGYVTKPIFTTGPVDTYTGENAYQRELKHNYIRAYVASHPNTVLFDFADILCYNNSGEECTENWNDGGTIRTYAQGHPDNDFGYDASWNIINEGDPDLDHIGEVGALRIAKAMWWMLARIAGWDGASK